MYSSLRPEHKIRRLSFGYIDEKTQLRAPTVDRCVTRANGEAEANKIRQTSLTPQLLELRKIENQKALIDRWNGQLPSVQTGNGGMGGLLMEIPMP